MTAPPLEERILVVGTGVTNRAAAVALVEHGHTVVLCDDGDAEALQRFAAGLEGPGVVAEVVHRPDADELDRLGAVVDAALPTPGLADGHPLFATARRRGLPVLSEFDLAATWDSRPVVAVTGTNGKTTVTTLVDEMLRAAGIVSRAVGNLATPLVAAVADPDVEVFVVEASSFRLGRSRHVAPTVGTWLNFAEDHLDVHADLPSYRAAKARIWAQQAAGAVAVGNAQDPVVAAELAAVAAERTTVTFGLAPSVHGAPVDWHEADGALVGPGGRHLVASSELWSDLPHDRANALAAAATAVAAGGHHDGVVAALRAFAGLEHRARVVAEAAGTRWVDDSKSTAPHSTLSAVAGSGRVVLIAGGRNKGLDLSVLSAVGSQVVAVVGIGESADEVLAALPSTPGAVAGSMDEAVALAARWAAPGVDVLLSPACASFDWYGSYAERGDDFIRAVREHLGATSDTATVGGGR